MNTIKNITRPALLALCMLLMFKTVFRQQLSGEVINIVWISISSMLLGILISGLILEKRYKRLIVLGIILLVYVAFAILLHNYIISR